MQRGELTFNPKTQKWVKRLRTSAVGKAKGKAYENQVMLHSIPDATAWLPIRITIQDLTERMDSVWTRDKSWELDKALATINTFYINRYCKGYKNKHIRKNGYMYISDRQFRKWVHDTDFGYYIDALSATQILLVHKIPSPYNSLKTFKYFKINPTLLNGEQQWYKANYQTDFMKVKVFNWKQKRKREKDVNNTRKQLRVWAEELVRCFDYERLENDLSDVKTPFDNRTVDDILRITKGFIDGDVFWCNEKDDSGHRFHSPFTSMYSFLLQYLIIDGEPAVETDIKNSQMMFFTLCFEDFDIVYPLLREDDKDNLFRGALRTIQCYRDKSDMKTFIEWARSGIIYEEIGKRFGKDKKWGKNIMFKVLFSNAEQCLKAKELVSPIFPSIVELSNILNGKKLIPLMMQRLEAKIMIDSVSTELIRKNIGPITTCHDSIIYKSSQKKVVKETIQEVFQSMGLPIPKVGDKE